MSGLTFQDDLHVLNKKGDNYINFQVVRQDMSGDPTYNMWISSEGRYIIMERNATVSTDITTKYFTAKIADETLQVAWDDRAGKTYIEYNSLFT